MRLGVELVPAFSFLDCWRVARTAINEKIAPKKSMKADSLDFHAIGVPSFRARLPASGVYRTDQPGDLNDA